MNGDKTDRRIMYIGAYLVALHAACHNGAIDPDQWAKDQANKGVTNLDEFESKQAEEE